MANDTSVIKNFARTEYDDNVDGGDTGYDADSEWTGRRTVGQWRRPRKSRKGPPFRASTETSMDTEEEAGDEEYEADDEWCRRPKISQTRKFMKRKWGSPRRSAETEDTDYLQHNGYFSDDRERDEHEPGDLRLDSDFSYGYGD